MKSTKTCKIPALISLDELPAILKGARKNKALTQQALADRAGVSKTTIEQYERGKRSPHLALLEAIFGALGFELWVAVIKK